MLCNIGENAHSRNRGGRRNRLPFGLVVEAHVTTHDRQSQGQAGIAHTSNGALKLPHDFWLFRVTEIETVGKCHRPSTAYCEIAGTFSYGDLRTPIGVEQAVAAITINGQANPLGGAFKPYDSRVRTRLNHGVATHK